ncbi:hypothetical protein KZ483_08065 [Paenibacillus sp. sptzw28]|uniref:OmpL47-type beta-barrel domain-containing protein n=1 Tax=Paenibacillus sp. sptzw28 TaxID=715179 RepID=UPI001C6EE935|nr:hypothetical protein [Paenibacillus sp. sptzw28]QYR22874.1 hypothetical protein KZ483_08065 [Paenibacillus sp. sptzw28]
MISWYDHQPVAALTPNLGSAWTNVTEYTLTVTDDGTNVKMYWLLTYNSSEMERGEGTAVKISRDGRNFLMVLSKDSGGHESHYGFYINVDTTAPVTTYKVTPVYGTDKPDKYIKGYTVTLNASDQLSGVKATFYRVNGGTWRKYTAPINLQPGGNTNLEYYSEDNAGNKEVHS